jgi:hypothetical protein
MSVAMGACLWGINLLAGAARPALVNGDFEAAGFAGWLADANWVVATNTCGYYSGWHGGHWAWSGGQGEAATGILKSKPFTLDKPGVGFLISGWSSIHGTGQPRRWNHVSLHLADGTEIDRVYAPDTTRFVPAVLNGARHRGKTVYVQAVDDADQPTFSMLCLDRVRTVDLPAEFTEPLARVTRFRPKRPLRLEDEHCLVEVDRAQGSITRIRDKRTGLELIREPRLAGSFRFALPLPGKEPWQTLEANWIFGRDQRLSSYELRGRQLALHWRGPLKNYLGERFDASATMVLELREAGLRCALSIENRTPYPIGETYFPVIGGIQGLGHTRSQLRTTQLVRPAGASPAARAGESAPATATAPASPPFAKAPIFRVFDNLSWLGDQGPEQFFAYPEARPPPTIADAPKIQVLREPWLGFTAPKLNRSVLLAAPESPARTLYFRLELVPASSGTLRDDGNWPRPEELDGLPVGVEFSIVDLEGAPSGRPYAAAPVWLRFLDGAEAEMSASNLSFLREQPRSPPPRP